AARRPPGAERDVVETGLEHAQQVLARDTRSPVGFLVHVDELLLEDAVDTTGLLLLAQLAEVLAALTLAIAAVLTRRVGTALDRALHRVALGALEEQLLL